MKSTRLTPPDTYPHLKLAADVRYAVDKLNHEGGLVFTSFTINGRFSLLLRGKPEAVTKVETGLTAFGWHELRQPEIDKQISFLMDTAALVEEGVQN